MDRALTGPLHLDPGGRARRLAVRGGAAAVVGLLLVAGCASAPAADTDRYTAVIEAAQASPPSDFLADVVADGAVTADEYDEAVSRYVECVNAAFPELDPPPASAERGPDGLVTGFTFGGPDEVVTSAEADEVQRSCNDRYFGEVGLLFEEMVTNP